MCSFRPIDDISAALKRLTALRELVGGDVVVEFLETESVGLRALFSSLMRCPQAAVEKALDGVTKQLSEGASDGKDVDADADELFQRLQTFYPGDVGCFAAYLLNHVRMKPGEAFFMAPNEPHAYLSGQCVEIMACSDNVIRAGLTPKYKDVDTLIDILTYNAGKPAMIPGEKLPEGSVLYRAAAKEFQLVKYDVGKSESVECPPHKGPGLLLVLSGSAEIECKGERTVAKKGFAACVPDSASVTLAAGGEGVVLFRASVNQAE